MPGSGGKSSEEIEDQIKHLAQEKGIAPPLGRLQLSAHSREPIARCDVRTTEIRRPNVELERWRRWQGTTEQQGIFSEGHSSERSRNTLPQNSAKFKTSNLSYFFEKRPHSLPISFFSR